MWLWMVFVPHVLRDNLGAVLRFDLDPEDRERDLAVRIQLNVIDDDIDCFRTIKKY